METRFGAEEEGAKHNCDRRLGEVVHDDLLGMAGF